MVLLVHFQPNCGLAVPLISAPTPHIPENWLVDWNLVITMGITEMP
jgi:hypothetical protein